MSLRRDEVIAMGPELLLIFVVEAFDGRFFDGAVHPLYLSIGSRMVWLEACAAGLLPSWPPHPRSSPWSERASGQPLILDRFALTPLRERRGIYPKIAAHHR